MALRGALGPRWSPVTPRHFAWQAWHLVTSTFVLRGRRGTYGTAWRVWSPLVACDAAALCVAGVALGFTWQAWHNLTSTFVMRGRRGTYGTAWRAWSPLVACDAATLCVAGVALGDIHLRFAWQAWHKDTSIFVLTALRGGLGRRWSPVTPRHFAWQAWHLVTSTFALRGMRGTYGTAWRAWWHKETSTLSPPWFCVAGVALRGTLGRRWSPVTPQHFAWQAWHLVSRGKRGTLSHLPS